jgi:hypothetical protein
MAAEGSNALLASGQAQRLAGGLFARHALRPASCSVVLNTLGAPELA